MARRMVAAGTILPDRHLGDWCTRMEIRCTDGERIYGNRYMLPDQHAYAAGLNPRGYVLRRMFQGLARVVGR